MKFPWFPAEASTMASEVDRLYLFMTGVSVVILGVVFLSLAFCLVKYRRGRKANRNALRISTMKIEVTWTAIPFLLAMGMFAWGARVYYRMQVPPPDTMEINVVGKQWMWKVQHREGKREINELHLPVGRPVKLTLASEDVIHSFFVPAFRVKQDVVPGRFVTAWFTPTREGAYHLFCAEYCGTEHSGMTGTVFVMSPAEYESWLDRGGNDSLAISGARLYRSLGCSGCHEQNGPVAAPRLDGLFGRQVPLQNGDFVRADDAYLRDSILLPQTQITAGYAPVMPTFQNRVSEEELFLLIAYIKSLSPAAPPRNEIDDAEGPGELP